MNRFKGWTASAVEQHNMRFEKKFGNISNLPQKQSDLSENYFVKPGDISKEKSKVLTRDYVGEIVSALEILGVPDVRREYKFLHDRRFRFDAAIPSAMIAIEFEGGVWTNGRHTRGKGYVNDAKKYNLATMHGWKLLRYTVEDTKQDNWAFAIASEIKKLIEE